MILLIETTAFTQKSLFHLIIWKGSILLAYFLSVIQKEAMPLSGLNCGGMILGIKISKNHWNRSGFDLKGAALSELALASSGFGEDVFAVVAGNYSLGMTEDHSGLVAASAFDVHEIRVGSGHQALELVTLPFSFEGGVKQVSVHCCWLKILGIFYYLIIPLFFKSLNSFTNTQNSSHVRSDNNRQL